MKFHQVREGERFEFEGETYTKIDRLKARHEASGRHRIVRRSATVRSLITTLPADAATPVRRLSGAEVSAAFEVFYRRCRHCLAELAPDSGALERAYDDLDAARRRFLGTLELGAARERDWR
jgi:hypothetical protein